MKLQELFEAEQFKTQISALQAWELLNEHCQDALLHMHEPIVRGMKKLTGGFGIIHGEAGQRKSANTTNYYTVIFDHTLSPLGFPKRSQSTICASWKNLSYTEDFGNRYAIVPFDGVKIGVCPRHDMWYTNIEIFGLRDEVDDWNDTWARLDIKEPTSFEQFINALDDFRIEDQTKYHARLNKILPWYKDDDTMILEAIRSCESKTELQDKIEQAYSAEACGFKLATTKTPELYSGVHEVWIGGKCVAIDLKIYRQMMKEHAR